MNGLDPREVYARVTATPEYAAAREKSEEAQRDLMAANERLRAATAVVTRIYDTVIAQMTKEGQ